MDAQLPYPQDHSGDGCHSVAHAAEPTPADVERVGAGLNFKGRIEREDWIGQAKAAHLAKYGEQL